MTRRHLLTMSGRKSKKPRIPAHRRLAAFKDAEPVVVKRRMMGLRRHGGKVIYARKEANGYDNLDDYFSDEESESESEEEDPQRSKTPTLLRESTQTRTPLSKHRRSRSAVEKLTGAKSTTKKQQPDAAEHKDKAVNNNLTPLQKRLNRSRALSVLSKSKLRNSTSSAARTSPRKGHVSYTDGSDDDEIPTNRTSTPLVQSRSRRSSRSAKKSDVGKFSAIRNTTQNRTAESEDEVIDNNLTPLQKRLNRSRELSVLSKNKLRNSTSSAARTSPQKGHESTGVKKSRRKRTPFGPTSKISLSKSEKRGTSARSVTRTDKPAPTRSSQKRLSFMDHDGSSSDDSIHVASSIDTPPPTVRSVAAHSRTSGRRSSSIPSSKRYKAATPEIDNGTYIEVEVTSSEAEKDNSIEAADPTPPKKVTRGRPKKKARENSASSSLKPSPRTLPRKSKRKRIERLQAHQRVEYEMDDEGYFEVARVIDTYTPDTPPMTSWEKKALGLINNNKNNIQKKKRKEKKDKSSGKKRHVIADDDKTDDDNDSDKDRVKAEIAMSEEVENPLVLCENMDGVEVEIDCVRTKEMWNPIPVDPAKNKDNAPMLLDRVIHDGISFGVIIIRPLEEKGAQRSEEHNLVFTIQSGIVQVKIADTSFVLHKHASFFVPANNPYNITNLHSKKEANLLFIRSKALKL